MSNLKDLMENRSFSFIGNVRNDHDSLVEKAMSIVRELLSDALYESCSLLLCDNYELPHIDNGITSACANDLLAYYKKDPSAVEGIEVLARSSTSYAATLHYRLAHWIYKNQNIPHSNSVNAMISRRGKILSGAEIHYKCNIGERFVLDHGVGTVIGETSTIGNDCYILGGVTLGSRRIANNISELRHPTLGDRVQVGMNANLLGPIYIGDDCFIGAGCVVSSDVIAESRVTVNQTHTIYYKKHEVHHASN